MGNIRYRQLVLHLHFTKSIKRDSTYKLCLWNKKPPCSVLLNCAKSLVTVLGNIQNMVKEHES